MKSTAKDDRILELGSGQQPMTDYLKIKERKITLSDNNPKVAHKSTGMLTLDACDLARNVKDEFSLVYMRDVLTTMIVGEVKRSCEKVFKTVKSGGTLVHIKTLDPYFECITDPFYDEKMTLFFNIGDGGVKTSFYVVDRAKLEQALIRVGQKKSNKKSPKEVFSIKMA